MIKANSSSGAFLRLLIFERVLVTPLAAPTTAMMLAVIDRGSAITKKRRLESFVDVVDFLLGSSGENAET